MNMIVSPPTAAPSPEANASFLLNRTTLWLYTWEIQSLMRGHPAVKRLLDSGHKFAPGKCHRYPLGNRAHVAYSAETDRASFRGLYACGSPHVCGICGPKISVARQHEVQFLIDSHQANGGGVYMLTLTTQHNLEDKLVHLVDGLQSAWASFRRHRTARDLLSDCGQVGYIRALETTFGSLNGWHPHFHVLLFMDRGVNASDLERALFPIWQSSVLDKLGKQVHPLHGLNLIHGDSSSDYIAKANSADTLCGSVKDISRSVIDPKADKKRWPLAAEVTKAQYKGAKNENYNPFSLPAYQKYDEFLEYYFATRGRQRITYSQDLRRLYDLDAAKDQDIADTPEDGKLIAEISRYLPWLTSAPGRMTDLLRFVEWANGDESAVSRYLEDLPISP